MFIPFWVIRSIRVRRAPIMNNDYCAGLWGKCYDLKCPKNLNEKEKGQVTAWICWMTRFSIKIVLEFMSWTYCKSAVIKAKVGSRTYLYSFFSALFFNCRMLSNPKACCLDRCVSFSSLFCGPQPCRRSQRRSTVGQLTCGALPSFCGSWWPEKCLLLTCLTWK